MDSDDVVYTNGTRPVFNGTTEAAVRWLEKNHSDEPRWVYLGKTGDVLTESEYLDLAT